MWSADQVVFVADRVQPRLGMARALESLLRIMPPEQVELVIISGPPLTGAACRVTALDQPPGWRGRLRAIPQLRRLACARSKSGAVIVAVGSWAFTALALATLFTRSTIVLWEHSILPWRLRKEWRIRILAAALRVLWFRLARVVCVSDTNCTTVAKFVWPVRSLSVIPNVLADVDASRRAVPAVKAGPDEPVKLMGVGSLTHGKNWELAVRAMAHLPENYSLDIAGDGYDYERLNELVSTLRLRGRVTLLKYVAGADDMMGRADVILHPSCAETFGYTLIEAAARFRPVVVLNKPVMNEIVPSYACGEVAGATPIKYAEAIIRATRSDYDHSKAASAREEVFSADVVLASWSALFAGLRR